MNRTPGERKDGQMKKPVIAALSAALGLVVAAALFGINGMANANTALITLADSAQDSLPVATALPEPPPAFTSDAEATADLTDKPVAPKRTVSAPKSAAPAPATPRSSGNTAPSAPRAPTQSAPRAAASAPAPKPAPAPAPAPKPAPATTCPYSQGENPAMWSACRAGYVAPTISFAGIVSCSAIDRAAGTWAVTIKWRASGGNYRGSFTGLTNNAAGTSSLTIHGVPVDALSGSGVVAPGTTARMSMSSMNGLSGPQIDVVTGSAGFVPMSSGCS